MNALEWLDYIIFLLTQILLLFLRPPKGCVPSPFDCICGRRVILVWFRTVVATQLQRASLVAD